MFSQRWGISWIPFPEDILVTRSAGNGPPLGKCAQHGLSLGRMDPTSAGRVSCVFDTIEAILSACMAQMNAKSLMELLRVGTYIFQATHRSMLRTLSYVLNMVGTCIKTSHTNKHQNVLNAFVKLNQKHDNSALYSNMKRSNLCFCRGCICGALCKEPSSWNLSSNVTISTTDHNG